MHWSGRCHVRELPHRIGEPPPDRCAGTIAIQRKFLRAYRAFQLGLIAVTLQHQVGDAPDIEFGDYAGKLSGEPIFLANAPEVLGLRRVTSWRSPAMTTARRPGARSWPLWSNSRTRPRLAGSTNGQDLSLVPVLDRS